MDGGTCNLPLLNFLYKIDLRNVVPEKKEWK
jgi:hypothetical protein